MPGKYPNFPSNWENTDHPVYKRRCKARRDFPFGNGTLSRAEGGRGLMSGLIAKHPSRVLNSHLVSDAGFGQRMTSAKGCLVGASGRTAKG